MPIIYKSKFFVKYFYTGKFLEKKCIKCQNIERTGIKDSFFISVGNEPSGGCE